MMKLQGAPVFAALACLSCGLGNAQGTGERPATLDVADLKGQVVAITILSDAEDLVLLSDVAVQRIGGKPFIKGKGLDDGETTDWRDDATVYVPLDDVQQIVAFADLQAYRRSRDARQSRPEGKAASSRKRVPWT